ncbi:uncharacterized protein LOC119512523 [Choloepus didactylus]|uniref:uncharacterized protein LOC119512523 n=1 Tax=Choloepus didactylus TaxID=27675 RepID=UPI00189D213E|nr:uncharacterized protein LOC119512523 [Choloepus didactylus]
MHFCTHTLMPHPRVTQCTESCACTFLVCTRTHVTHMPRVHTPSSCHTHVLLILHMHLQTHTRLCTFPVKRNRFWIASFHGQCSEQLHVDSGVRKPSCSRNCDAPWRGPALRAWGGSEPPADPFAPLLSLLRHWLWVLAPHIGLPGSATGNSGYLPACVHTGGPRASLHVRVCLRMWTCFLQCRLRWPQLQAKLYQSLQNFCVGCALLPGAGLRPPWETGLSAGEGTPCIPGTPSGLSSTHTPPSLLLPSPPPPTLPLDPLPVSLYLTAPFISQLLVSRPPLGRQHKPVCQGHRQSPVSPGACP